MPEVLVYAGVAGDRRFSTQWTVFAGNEVHLYLELDLAAIGRGASTIRQRARLLCDDRGQPVRYETEARGTKVTLEFDADVVKVELPDGSRQMVPREGARFVIEANLTGLQAILLAQERKEAMCFSVNGLVAVPYRLQPAPELGAGWLRSSHQEELLLEDEVLVEVRVPSQHVSFRRELPPPPLPDWHAGELRAAEPLRYTPPANTSVRFEDVTIDGPVTPIGATLTLPAQAAPCPAVLFLSGSGTHDRHGMTGQIDIGTHEIVDHLAERGFAGLRYDTRGAGTTRIGDDALEQGLETLIADARAARAWLESRPEVDRRRLFLIGHSQGANLALALAEEAPPAGVVLMAAIGRPIEEVLIDQVTGDARRRGLSPAEVEEQARQLRELVALATSDKEWVAGEIPDHLLGAVRLRRWIREHMQRPAAELIRRLRCPVLLLQGGEDIQVSPERDAAPLAEAARQAGLDVTYHLLPALDHLFKRVPAGERSELKQYADRTRRVDSAFLASLDDWLRQKAAP